MRRRAARVIERFCRPRPTADYCLSFSLPPPPFFLFSSFFPRSCSSSRCLRHAGAYSPIIHAFADHLRPRTPPRCFSYVTLPVSAAVAGGIGKQGTNLADEISRRSAAAAAARTMTGSEKRREPRERSRSAVTSPALELERRVPSD